jgi:prepilin-type N-terminal cleavage/methylation domain-containing protein
MFSFTKPSRQTKAFTLMELLVALSLVVLVISLAYSYSSSSQILTSRKLDEFGALGNARRILQCINQELKSSSKVLLPTEKTPVSKYLVIQNSQGQWVQFFFDNRGRFCSRSFGGEPSKVRIRVGQPGTRIVLHDKQFLRRKESELEFYLVYRVLQREKEEALIEIFDSFSL